MAAAKATIALEATTKLAIIASKICHQRVISGTQCNQRKDKDKWKILVKINKLLLGFNVDY
jgi:hypothetical protein